MPDDAVDLLSKVSGVDRAEIMEILAGVKANHARLDACAGPHDFSIPERQVGSLVHEWRCTKCHGTVPTVERSWYLAGLAHALK